MAETDRPACCADPANLARTRPAPDQLVDTCRACGRKHYRVLVPLGAIVSPPGADLDRHAAATATAAVAKWDAKNKG